MKSQAEVSQKIEFGVWWFNRTGQLCYNSAAGAAAYRAFGQGKLVMVRSQAAKTVLVEGSAR